MTWQWRADTGCMHGGDVRIGMEKDGVSAWCEVRPPAMWTGQHVGKREERCRDDGWYADELQGQCFGLGDKRQVAVDTAAGCRDACCADPKGCGVWQWRPNVGCFYNDGGLGRCDKPETVPFQGRRKNMPGRAYTPRWDSQGYRRH